jgi:hypothetical protein
MSNTFFLLLFRRFQAVFGQFRFTQLLGILAGPGKISLTA